MLSDASELLKMSLKASSKTVLEGKEKTITGNQKEKNLLQLNILVSEDNNGVLFTCFQES